MIYGDALSTSHLIINFCHMLSFNNFLIFGVNPLTKNEHIILKFKMGGKKLTIDE